eukprot:TRINITY_DN918_c0_g1_i6.p1 TRINITY_DN918_c0_g1~~TRINITY_DN918_c0_g1_i6.p1  ORF type:complete len:175 (+),score=32.74 TRINITY_DN918_c0_g1_i6:554-1078(+)
MGKIELSVKQNEGVDICNYDSFEGAKGHINGVISVSQKFDVNIKLKKKKDFDLIANYLAGEQRRGRFIFTVDQVAWPGAVKGGVIGCVVGAAATAGIAFGSGLVEGGVIMLAGVACPVLGVIVVGGLLVAVVGTVVGYKKASYSVTVKPVDNPDGTRSIHLKGELNDSSPKIAE